MPRNFLAVLAVALWFGGPSIADDTADSAKARTAHAKELARLKAELLAAIDQRMRDNQRAGRRNDFLIDERKAFAENGVTPLLPEMQPAVKAYLDGKRKVDQALAGALARAGYPDEAQPVREKGPKPAADPKDDLRATLTGSVWDWGDGDLYLRSDGQCGNTLWAERGYAVRWEAFDRRTVILYVEKGREHNRTATLRLNEAVTEMTGYNFGGEAIKSPKKRLR